MPWQDSLFFSTKNLSSQVPELAVQLPTHHGLTNAVGMPRGDYGVVVEPLKGGAEEEL
jgi:hypothetical protein